jgi:tetratricopeptide (TPR) repeat protein
MTNELPLLDEALERAWRLLERRQRRLHGFGLLVYLVRTPRLARQLQQRLQQHLKQQGRQLTSIAVLHPEQFASVTLASLFSAMRAPAVGACWLEAYRGAGQVAWDMSRRELLMRLNERRGLLETRLAGPLILLLPEDGAQEMAHVAPDLWHVRLLVESLAAHVDEAESVPVNPVDSTPPGCRLVPVFRGSDAFDPEVDRILKDWREQWAACFDALHWQSLLADHPRLDDIALSDGLRASQISVRHGRLSQARHVAQEVLAVAQRRVDRAGSDRQPRRLRDLASAWAQWGDACRYDDVEQARHADHEALRWRREVVALELESSGWILPVSRLATDELMAALLTVAQVEMLSGGHLDMAEVCLRELLDLVEASEGEGWHDDVVSTRQRWSALYELGRLMLMQGRATAAISAYQEAEILADRMVRSLPDAQVCRHDRWCARIGLGQAHGQNDRPASAWRAFSEALPDARWLLAVAADAAERSSAASGLALTLQALARHDEARAPELLSEAATIYASLVQRHPGVQHYADRLAEVQSLQAALATDSDSSSDPK